MKPKSAHSSNPPAFKEPAPPNGSDESLKKASGFASALCYLAYEAGECGWASTQACLEKAYNAFVKELADVEIGPMTLPVARNPNVTANRGRTTDA